MGSVSAWVSPGLLGLLGTCCGVLFALVTWRKAALDSQTLAATSYKELAEAEGRRADSAEKSSAAVSAKVALLDARLQHLEMELTRSDMLIDLSRQAERRLEEIVSILLPHVQAVPEIKRLADTRLSELTSIRARRFKEIEEWRERQSRDDRHDAEVRG